MICTQFYTYLTKHSEKFNWESMAAIARQILGTNTGGGQGFEPILSVIMDRVCTQQQSLRTDQLLLIYPSMRLFQERSSSQQQKIKSVVLQIRARILGAGREIESSGIRAFFSEELKFRFLPEDDPVTSFMIKQYEGKVFKLTASENV